MVATVAVAGIAAPLAITAGLSALGFGAAGVGAGVCLAQAGLLLVHRVQWALLFLPAGFCLAGSSVPFLGQRLKRCDWPRPIRFWTSSSSAASRSGGASLNASLNSALLQLEGQVDPAWELPLSVGLDYVKVWLKEPELRQDVEGCLSLLCAFKVLKQQSFSPH